MDLFQGYTLFLFILLEYDTTYFSADRNIFHLFSWVSNISNDSSYTCISTSNITKDYENCLRVTDYCGSWHQYSRKVSVFL